jgi:hypothetical protein
MAVNVKGVNGRIQVLQDSNGILNEVSTERPGGWKLCFQRVRYIYDDGTIQEGYRFIWRRPDNSLQAARGQARIPSLKVASSLIAEAEKAGWGHYDADNDDARFDDPIAA